LKKKKHTLPPQKLHKTLNLTVFALVVALGVDLLHNVGMKIEKNIPLPGGVDPRERYPFPDMALGDSFMILDATWIKNLRSAAYMYSKRHPGTRFTCRRHGEGWRLWRVA
jgi:hypothetical protein